MAAIFLVIGLGLSAAEIAAPGLVLLPFGGGGVIAALTGFLGAPPLVQAVVFLVSSAALFLALRPVAKRLNRVDSDDGVGARRLIGARGVVLEDIPVDDSGLVRINRETWRAEAPDEGVLVAGTTISVTEVRGTRVVVTPASPRSITPPPHPPTEPPPGGEPT